MRKHALAPPSRRETAEEGGYAIDSAIFAQEARLAA